MPVKKKTVRNTPKLPKNVKINQKRKSQKKRGRRASRRQRGGSNSKIDCKSIAHQFLDGLKANILPLVEKKGREGFAREIFETGDYKARVKKLFVLLTNDRGYNERYILGPWMDCFKNQNPHNVEKCVFRDGTSFISGLEQHNRDHTKFYETLKLFIDKPETSSGLLGTKKTVKYTVTELNCGLADINVK